MYAPSPPAILVRLKVPDPSIMGINLQMSQKAKTSRDKIGALDKEDGGNGGEASCEKGASNSAGRSRERSNRGARWCRLGDAVKKN